MGVDASLSDAAATAAGAVPARGCWSCWLVLGLVVRWRVCRRVFWCTVGRAGVCGVDGRDGQEGRAEVANLREQAVQLGLVGDHSAQ